ncbi:molybdopterin synthase sulfur carrier subunit [Microbacterium sp. AISO3]|jgi:sulfur-carrier protein|uniref:Molybdopterin synthase sulfur carrier subunit n=2 Tax=Microbacterium TaxID=33882 RepID=A0ABU1I5D3_9MICO|nr:MULTISPECIES: MoaD/ThiS family protein [Microbacterium]APF33897.1 molybdopterin synthase sulfur carrier subunit [Microbacterium paludicola]MDR6168856.1 molybdopterin synthase sulfur carrier subunit [Microbacterium paludicola]OAZ40838.1 molybdopterin synthase sulfur carrier subunit [Microbacterium arborescens]OWP21178.1 molybdopterin synthase sulfur carrier subunit [Microbacterium sp. AISO3]POX67593.1 MoaD/ThiS family protein [Microbacterium sp. Ru50]
MARVRYFAAAAERAGRSEEVRSENSLGALRDALSREHPGLAAILPKCAVLVDGARAADSSEIGPDVTVDILPPFAGG